MAINAVRYSDWAYLSPGDVELPTRVRDPHLSPEQDKGVQSSSQSVFVPADAETDGFIAFTYVTKQGLDPFIDIKFSLDEQWFIETGQTTQAEFRSMHWAVSVLPGKMNNFVFNVDRGGTLSVDPDIPAPPMNFGGAGLVVFQNIILFYHRVRQEQEHWKYCFKCKGLFFLDNPGSSCPAGGSHDPSQSGDYQMTATIG